MIGYGTDYPDAGGADEAGAVLLDQVHAFITRFVVMPHRHAAVAATLWAAHAHVVERFDSTPRLTFLSPEPGSGKSRALEVLGALVPGAMHAVNATPAALFRSVSDLDQRPTILFDEIDTVFGPKAGDHEETRGFLNAGHRRGAVAYRCVGLGTAQKVIAFPAFAPVALAGLDKVPDTIATRSVIVRMRRRAPGEQVEPFRFRHHEPEGHKLRDELAAWLVGVTLDDEPPLPDGVTDRAADVWEPLLSIADAAGGDWPDRARSACVHMVAESADSEPSLAVRLLIDTRDVWVEWKNPEVLPTELLLRGLRGIDESPWDDLRGKPLDARGLARMLSRFGVRPQTVRTTAGTAKGYRRADLVDPWARYLPTRAASGAVTSVTPSQTGEEPQVRATNGPDEAIRHVPSQASQADTECDAVTDSRFRPSHPDTPPDQGKHTDCDGVSDVTAPTAGRPSHTRCAVCGEPLTVTDPGQTTHPGCDPDGGVS